MTPRAAVERYLDRHRSEFDGANRRQLALVLRTFVRWTGDAGIERISELDGQPLVRYEEWRNNQPGLSVIKYDNRRTILRPFLAFCEEINAVEEELSEGDSAATQRPAGKTPDIVPTDEPESQSSDASDDAADAPSRLEPLTDRQQTVYLELIERFESYLREEGKVPRKNIGYAEDSINPRVSRLKRAFDWIWEQEEVTTELTTDHADRVIEALDTDEFRQQDGQRYSEESKRKTSDVLVNWFAFRGEDWEPKIRFKGEDATGNADPFTRNELDALWQAALRYKSIPRYNNLSPTERDRWKAHIAQELGKPKSDVSPTDWDAINKSWKVPALIRTTRSAGWRPAMVARLRVDWYDPSTGTIHIPQGEAVKNDAPWDQELDEESAMALEKWLEQRENIERYDGRDEIWLNREGNPYGSASLNRLLDNLLEDAGIEPFGRKLVWYSFRHSIGTYVFDEYQDLKIVAEVLRQKSEASAVHYVHPTAELKREASGVT